LPPNSDSRTSATGLVHRLVTSVSSPILRKLITLLQSESSFADIMDAKLVHGIAQDDTRQRIKDFLASVRAREPSITPAELAFGLACALQTRQNETDRENVELVWTGPQGSSVPVRRSAAVLLELVNSATSDLYVISFAAFGIPDARESLRQAAKRGVAISLILESAEDSGGHFKSFSRDRFADLAATTGIRCYRWPLERRSKGAVLHAKAVVADGRSALITSANLTDHAIESNIELGLLIEGGSVPLRLRSLLRSLIDAGEFVAVNH
jgi:phosphatidylserine/phosphatidylglycerophosphate/cardiolipin synthase-like enzyme